MQAHTHSLKYIFNICLLLLLFLWLSPGQYRGSSYFKSGSPDLTKKIKSKGFPGGPVVKTPCCNCREPQVQALVSELRSHVLRPLKKKMKKKITSKEKT